MLPKDSDRILESLPKVQHEYDEVHPWIHLSSRDRICRNTFEERFDFVSKIGGSMGNVYKAFDRKLSRSVAIKAIPPDRLSTGELDRLFNEACFQASLIHPHIVTIHDIGVCDGIPVIVMEWLPGGSLAEALKRKTLTVVFVASLMEPIARALEFAHSCGVVHSDVKPSNILLTETGEWKIDHASSFLLAKLADFGMARDKGEWIDSDDQRKTGGTLPYCAPELLSLMYSKNTPASDIYALGMTLYESAALRLPFRAENRKALIEEILAGEIAPLREFVPGIDPGYESICMKCLARDPVERYPTAQAVALDLRKFLIESLSPKDPQSFWERIRHWWNGNRKAE